MDQIIILTLMICLVGILWLWYGVSTNGFRWVRRLRGGKWELFRSRRGDFAWVHSGYEWLFDKDFVKKREEYPFK